MTEDVFRTAFFIVLLSAFLISGYYRRKARQTGDVINRRAEGLPILLLRMGLGLPLLILLLLYVFKPDWLNWSKVSLPGWLQWTALAAAFLCVPFLWWVFRSIGVNVSETVLTKREHNFVTWGPYRWIRHPLYAGALLLLLCFSLIAANWFLGGYWLVGVIAFRWVVIPREEAFLIQTFGQDYINYRQRTGALLPKVF